jgi:hypothetical protein
MAARSIHFRYRLRTLLLAMLVLGVGLGWWFRPFTLTQRWPNGKMQSELHVRRDWDGSLVTNGQQRWWWASGQLARRGESFGQPLPKMPEQIELANDEQWDQDGQLVTGGVFWIDWYVIRRLEESPRVVDWSVYRFAETEHGP